MPDGLLSGLAIALDYSAMGSPGFWETVLAKSKNKQKQKAAAAPERAAPASKIPQRLLLLISGAGIMVTGVLLVAADKALPYCANGSGCDVVQDSAWANFLGLPLPLLGLLSYLALGAAALMRSGITQERAVAVIAGSGFAISAYLTSISGTEIGAY